MTRLEAKRRLHEVLPKDLSFCIEIDDWYFDHTGDDKVTYCIATVGNNNGANDNCIRFEGDSLDEAVAKATEYFMTKLTDADRLLNEQFA